MKVKEKCSVTIHPKHAYGDKPMTNIPPNSTLIYEIELVDFEKAKELWESKGFDAVIQNAQERKEQGNGFFQNNQVDIAIRKYEKAMKYLDGNHKFSEEEKEQINNLKLPIQINLSLCYFKINDVKKSLDYANKALEIDPRNVKGLYRRGLAYAENSQWEYSLADYEKVLELDPGNAAAARAKAKLLKSMSKQDQKDKKRYANLFSVLSSDNQSHSNENN